MKRIEFIGASGVGKTTLFKSLLKERNFNDSWLTPEEARINVVKGLSHSQISSKRKLIKYYLIRFNLFQGKHKAYALDVLKQYEKEVFDNVLKDYNCLLQLKLDSLVNNDNIEPYRKARSVEFYLKVLMHDVAFLDYFNVNDIIVYHDGIIHNNSGITKLNDIKANQKYDKLYEKILPTGIICCKLSLDENYRRRKHRIATNKNRGTFIERGLSDEDLYDLCKRSLDSVERKAETLKSFGIPVLDINTAVNHKYNALMILEFIKEIM